MERLTSIFIALLLSVFLLAFPLEGYGAIGAFKYRLFLLLCGGYAAVMLIARAQLALIGNQPLGKIGTKIREIPLTLKLLFFLLLFVIISALLSNYSGTFVGMFRQEGALTIAIYVLTCFFVSRHIRPQKWMLYLLGLGAVLFSLLAFVQLTGANPFALYPDGHNYYGAGVYYSGEFLSTIGNAGVGAAYVSLVAGVLAMALIKFEFRGKWLLAFPLFIVALLIFEMGIYAALVALAIGFLLMLPVAITSQRTLANTLFVLAVFLVAFCLSQILVFQDGPILFAPIPVPFVLAAGFVALLAVLVRKSGKFATVPKGWYRGGAIAVILISIGGMFLFLWLYDGPESGMLYEASQVLRGRWDDTFGTRRIYIWRNVLEHIRLGNLLFGTGPDTLGFWSIEAFTRYIPEIGQTVVVGIDAAHNEYLHLLATNGLLALLAYLGALFFAAVNWLRSPDNPLLAVAGAGMLFYCIQAFFGISMPITAPFFWTCFAVFIYAQHSKEDKKI